MLSYLLALLEILFKVWRASDKVRVLRKLTNAEKFVLFVTVLLLFHGVIWLAYAFT